MLYLEMKAMTFLAGITSPELTRVMRDITVFGGRGVMMTVLAIAALWLLYRRRWQDVCLLLLAYGGGEMTLSFLKSFFQRARPTSPLVLTQGYSFPSGHAFGIMLLCGFLTYLIWPVFTSRWARRVTLVAYLSLILLVGFSRIY